MFGLGLTELLVILIIVVIVFGASRLPQIGSGLGKAIQGFRKEVSGNKTQDKDDNEDKQQIEKDDSKKD